MSTGNIQQTPKKISRSSTTINVSYCRLWKSVTDASYSKNIYGKGNRALLAAASSTITALTARWYGGLWNSSIPSLQDTNASECVKTISYFASFRGVYFAFLASNSKSWESLFIFAFKHVALKLTSLLLHIWSLIRAFKGETTITTGRNDEEGTSRWLFNFSKKSEGRRWKIKDLPYPVGKTATTSLPEYIASIHWTCLGFKLRLLYLLWDIATWRLL